MPFTFAHPAIILPLKNLPSKYVSMTGLIIGSMLPDFEYFIRMLIKSIYSHTLPGILYFDLPLGIVLALIFHLIVKNNLIDNLPDYLYNRLSIYKNAHWIQYFKKNILIVCISIIIGTLSHILWDMFTHPTGYFVQIMPILDSKIHISSLQIPVYKILQHGSTCIGALVILFYINKQKIYPSEMRKVDIKYWILWGGLTLIILTCKLTFGYSPFIGNIIVSSISAAILSLIFTSLIWSIIIKEKNNARK